MVNWASRRSRRPNLEPNGQAESEPEAEDDLARKLEKLAALVARVRAAADALGLSGEILPFGSYVNGFATSSSDCDLSYMPPEGTNVEKPVRVLQQLAGELPRHGFTDIATVFQAKVPLVKAVDPSGTEVDLCVSNLLGHRNSKLIAAYCKLDPRVSQVGKLVKQWAKAADLVGCREGLLSSYAYTLLTIFYLMHTKPAVVPNLQDAAAVGEEAVIIRDRRWGHEIGWDCKFWEDVHLVPASACKESVESLLRGFFVFYSQEFDWASDVVSIRLALTGVTSKFNLYSSVREKEQWYVEDPFDLRHNLAAQCSPEGRQRILAEMEDSATRFQ